MRSAKLLSALMLLLAGSNIRADEKTRTFTEYQCRYTLPGDGWSWTDLRPTPEVICAARHPDGLVFMLAVVPLPEGTVIGEKFAAGFDEGAAKMPKRRGSLTTFKGLPCYESGWLLSGRTYVVRVIIANGRAYQLQLLGGADPVEKRPDFETIMGCFDFTSPPVAPVASSPEERASRKLGGVAGGCLLVAILLGLGRRAFRSK